TLLCVCVFLAHCSSSAGICTLSLHDALPIWGVGSRRMLRAARFQLGRRGGRRVWLLGSLVLRGVSGMRKGTTVAGDPLRGSVVSSEEHTSELQSRFDIVCRLLLEK